MKKPTSLRVILSHRPFAHVVAIAAALLGCGGVMTSSPDASSDAAAGCPSGSDVQTQAAVGKACASEGLLCPQPDCDPCTQECRAVTCTGGVWVATVNTGICIDAGACVTIDPTTFDSSCKVDSDCMGISTGTFCSGSAGAWCMCPAAGVNVDGQSQYQADMQALQSLGPHQVCTCPYFGAPRCIGNVCTVCGGANPCPDGG